MSCSKGVIKYTLITSANPVKGGTVKPEYYRMLLDEGQEISITAIPAAEYVFQSWTGATGTEETTIVMNSDKTVVANFVKKKYALTIKIEGEGTITEKIIKAGVATDYNSGTVVELTATPKVGWKFKEWKKEFTGNLGGNLADTDNPKQITIDKAKTVIAVFKEVD